MFAIKASASDADGTVTNVEFFCEWRDYWNGCFKPVQHRGEQSCRGSYALKAVATDNGGLTNASTPVNISVVAPVEVMLSAPLIHQRSIQFNYTANPGLRYVVQNSPQPDELEFAHDQHRFREQTSCMAGVRREFSAVFTVSSGCPIPDDRICSRGIPVQDCCSWNASFAMNWRDSASGVVQLCGMVHFGSSQRGRRHKPRKSASFWRCFNASH